MKTLYKYETFKNPRTLSKKCVSAAYQMVYDYHTSCFFKKSRMFLRRLRKC